MDKRHHAEDHTCDLDVGPHSVGSSRRIHLRGKNVFLMRPNVRVERREQGSEATLASVRIPTCGWGWLVGFAVSHGVFTRGFANTTEENTFQKSLHFPAFFCSWAFAS